MKVRDLLVFLLQTVYCLASMSVCEHFSSHTQSPTNTRKTEPLYQVGGRVPAFPPLLLKDLHLHLLRAAHAKVFLLHLREKFVACPSKLL